MTTTYVHTETTLKARHREALDIYHAWAERYRVTGGNEAKAVKIQMEEAWDWAQQTQRDLQHYREVMRQKTREHGRTAANTTGRLHAHRRA